MGPNKSAAKITYFCKFIGNKIYFCALFKINRFNRVFKLLNIYKSWLSFTQISCSAGNGLKITV